MYTPNTPQPYDIWEVAYYGAEEGCPELPANHPHVTHQIRLQLFGYVALFKTPETAQRYADTVKQHRQSRS